MAQAPLDVDLSKADKRPRALLLDVAHEIPAEALTSDGTQRWALNGITWVPWGSANITTDNIGCEETNFKDFSSFPSIETQKAFLLVDGIKCSSLSGAPSYLEERLDYNLDTYVSAALGVELMRGTFGGPNSFRTDVTQLAAGAARSLRLAFTDMETHLASMLHGGKGVLHLTPAAMVLAAADRLVHYIDGRWQSATGHDVVADAGYEGLAPQGGQAAGTDQDWLYASGPVWYALSPLVPVGRRNEESMRLTRNEYRFLSERYGLVAFDPNVVGGVRATLA